MWTWAGFWVVLHAEGWNIVASEALKSTVVQTNVGLGHSWHRPRLDCEIVVLACYFDSSVVDVSNGDVAAVVSEFHFVGSAAERQ